MITEELGGKSAETYDRALNSNKDAINTVLRNNVDELREKLHEYGDTSSKYAKGVTGAVINHLSAALDVTHEGMDKMHADAKKNSKALKDAKDKSKGKEAGGKSRSFDFMFDNMAAFAKGDMSSLLGEGFSTAVNALSPVDQAQIEQVKQQEKTNEILTRVEDKLGSNNKNNDYGKEDARKSDIMPSNREPAARVPKLDNVTQGFKSKSALLDSPIHGPMTEVEYYTGIKPRD